MCTKNPQNNFYLNAQACYKMREHIVAWSQGGVAGVASPSQYISSSPSALPTTRTLTKLDCLIRRYNLVSSVDFLLTIKTYNEPSAIDCIFSLSFLVSLSVSISVSFCFLSLSRCLSASLSLCLFLSVSVSLPISCLLSFSLSSLPIP